MEKKFFRYTCALCNQPYIDKDSSCILVHVREGEVVGIAEGLYDGCGSIVGNDSFYKPESEIGESINSIESIEASKNFDYAVTQRWVSIGKQEVLMNYNEFERFVGSDYKRVKDAGLPYNGTLLEKIEHWRCKSSVFITKVDEQDSFDVALTKIGKESAYLYWLKNFPCKSKKSGIIAMHKHCKELHPLQSYENGIALSGTDG